MISFTKGYWLALEAKENFCIDVINVEDGELELPIGKNWVCSVHQQFNGREVGEANARLIAAAPEMYKLLEGMSRSEDVHPMLHDEIQQLLTKINTPCSPSSTS